MDFIWPLVAMPVASLLYTAYVIARDSRHKLPDCVVPLSTLGPGAAKKTSYVPSHRREIRWVSMNECEDLIHTSTDIIFIDLGSPDEEKHFPIEAEHVLSISPSNILDVLQWLPPETTVVLYGASDLCTSMIWTVRNLAGVAPVYVLKAPAIHSEVA
jgi:hypothetical protein